MVGFIFLLLDIPGFFFTKGNVFILLPYVHLLCPFAGVLGLIPAPLVFFIFIPGSNIPHYIAPYVVFIPYIFLSLAIFLQKKVLDRVRLAIRENSRKDFVFKIVILHHFWTGLLFTQPILSILFHTYSSSLQNNPLLVLWSQYVFFNFPIAFGVWRWTKTEERLED